MNLGLDPQPWAPLAGLWALALYSLQGQVRDRWAWGVLCSGPARALPSRALGALQSNLRAGQLRGLGSGSSLFIPLGTAALLSLVNALLTWFIIFNCLIKERTGKGHDVTLLTDQPR